MVRYKQKLDIMLADYDPPESGWDLSPSADLGVLSDSFQVRPPGFWKFSRLHQGLHTVSAAIYILDCDEPTLVLSKKKNRSPCSLTTILLNSGLEPKCRSTGPGGVLSDSFPMVGQCFPAFPDGRGNDVPAAHGG